MATYWMVDGKQIPDAEYQEILRREELEDANGIQMAVMLVQRALIDDEISEKKAGLLLYSLQIAAANVDRTTFGQAADEEMVTDAQDEDEVIHRHAETMERQDRLEKVQSRRILPLMNAEEKMLPQPVDKGGAEIHAKLGWIGMWGPEVYANLG
jgi:hypothetical protein